MFFLLLNYVSNYWGLHKATAGLMGANDEENMSFGPYVSCFFYLCFSFKLNVKYRYFICFKDTEEFAEGYNNDNGPKRCKTCHLGPR